MYSGVARDRPSEGLGWSSMYKPGSDTCSSCGESGLPTLSVIALSAAVVALLLGKARLARHIIRPFTTSNTKTMQDKVMTVALKVRFKSADVEDL